MLLSITYGIYYSDIPDKKYIQSEGPHMTFSFESYIEKWQSGAGWFYVRLPKDIYNDLREASLSSKRGFGSIKVAATIGHTSWETSVFPDTKDKSFILFLKKSVRGAEELTLNSKPCVKISLKEL